MNRILKSVIVAGALLSPALVFAAPSDGGPAAGEHRRRHGGGLHRYKVVAAHAQELGITPAALESMKAAFEAARPEIEKLHQGLRQAHQSGDAAKVDAARSALHERRLALRAQVDGMLTEQQKAAIKQLVGRHHRGHGADSKKSPG